MKDQVYDACVPIAEEERNYVFFQPDIFDLDVIPNNDVQILLQVIQMLLDEKLFKVVANNEYGAGWRLRTKEDARRYVCISLLSHSN